MTVIQAAASDLGFEFKAREDYQASYGDPVCGLVFDSTSELLAAAAQAAADLEANSTADQDYTSDHLVRDVKRLRFDSMGLRQIAY